MAGFLRVVNLIVSVLAGAYFLKALLPEGRKVYSSHQAVRGKLTGFKERALPNPLSETVRPSKISGIVGQRDGIFALKAALFGKYPQHVILYGPPGVGKTTAARLIFEEAKKSKDSPFGKDAPFVEIDASILRFDERGIADPLMGSVHDPIYQGAGERGRVGAPTVKEGAVTRAHGGVLFLDEIGQMHPFQMNRLLKVMEDRVVRLESAYYDPYSAFTDDYMRLAFEKGLPADFRLIAATTKSPSELPGALRSRALEITFRPLSEKSRISIAKNAAKCLGVQMEEPLFQKIGKNAVSGRSCVNLVQLSSGAASLHSRTKIRKKDVEWAISAISGAQNMPGFIRRPPAPGIVYALSVNEAGKGMAVCIEAAVIEGTGRILLSGGAKEEEIALTDGRRVVRHTSLYASAVAARAYLMKEGFSLSDKDAVIRFPSSCLSDGPSAGIAIAVAIASFMEKKEVKNTAAVTGEISLSGEILPVGGIKAKVQAAKEMRFESVILPKGRSFIAEGIEIRQAADFECAYRWLCG